MSGTVKIKALRILPPFAIGRLGSADEPMDNYTIETEVEADEKRPLGYRRLKPLPTPVVDEKTGEIRDLRDPELPLAFKRHGRIRPVAPFLEVFADIGHDELVPLTLDLLKAAGHSLEDVSWSVRLANRKVARRTGDPKDEVATRDDLVIRDHQSHALLGYSPNFAAPEMSVVFGHARFIRPTGAYPQIRLRFTPGAGLIYGPESEPPQSESEAKSHGLLHYTTPREHAIYGAEGIWPGFQSDAGSESADPGWKVKRDQIWLANGWDPEKFDNETLPPSLFAIEPPAPSWLFDNRAVSRGYLDDACDGFVEVRLARGQGEPLKAVARVCAAPPAVAPDSLFVRTLADDFEQVLFGPKVDGGEDPEVSRARAQDIVRRAFETVRFMNVAVMNGNAFKGRIALTLDSMPEEEAADTERPLRPVMSPGSVDTKAITALHQAAYAALRGGAAPWFAPILRRPDEVADFTDHGRRKMPALMCGADNNYLALTWRQIRTIEKVAVGPRLKPAQPPDKPPLTPRNLAAQMHYEAMGNPISSRPITSVANCCPGLEVDFRAVWRRLFKGVELREYDNLVVRVDADDCDAETKMKVANLTGRRLLQIVTPDGVHHPTTTPIKGPASSDLLGFIELTTQENPEGLAPLEWSNALSDLHRYAGEHVRCDFSRERCWETQIALVEPKGDDPGNYESVDLVVRPFFEADTAVISEALAKAGELTQGLCSPWQNDYRECSCYYWASARPDFVNVETGPDGLSKGDNWFQRKRTGSYVPDDYADGRLVLYDELFGGWENILKFQIEGRDVPDSPPEGKT